MEYLLVGLILGHYLAWNVWEQPEWAKNIFNYVTNFVTSIFGKAKEKLDEVTKSSNNTSNTA